MCGLLLSSFHFVLGPVFQLSKLCHRLDEIWEENREGVILYLWFLFLQDEALDYLQISSHLDLDSVIPHTGGRSPKKKTAAASSKTSHGGGERGETIPGVEVEEEPTSDSPAKCGEADSDGTHGSQGGPTAGSPPPPPGVDAGGTGESARAQCDQRTVQDCASVTELWRVLVEFDKRTEEKEFERCGVQCAVCFTLQPGFQCMRFWECRHAFCKDCLRGYFKVQIREGDVKALNCPEPKCESQAYPHQVSHCCWLCAGVTGWLSG